MRVGGVMVAVLALITAAVVGAQAYSVNGKVTALKTVDAPGVTATSDFLYSIEDMDAQLANALLINGDHSLAMTREEAVRQYKDDQSQADRDLQTAATSAAGDAATLDQLTLVTTLFDAYKDRASRALQLDEQQGGTKAGGTPGTAGSQAQVAITAAYREANNALNRQADPRTPNLLAAAQMLTSQDSHAIAASSAEAQTSISIGGGTGLTLGILLVLALVFFQSSLAKRFHRTLNPALAAATLAALALVVVSSGAFTSAGDSLTTAKSQAFDSVQALTDAKAISVDANADESRWLLDPADAATFAQSFQDKARSIATLVDDNGDDMYAGGLNANLYGGGLGAEWSRLTSAGTATAAGLAATKLSATSKLGAEFRNVTFPGEADAALSVLQLYATYIDDDTKLRALNDATPKGFAAAIDFDTDTKKQGTSDTDFDLYVTALQRVIDLNQHEFDASMESARSDSALLTWLPFAFAAVIIGLVVAGLKPRLNEFRT